MAQKDSFDPFPAFFRRHLLSAVAVAAQQLTMINASNRMAISGPSDGRNWNVIHEKVSTECHLVKTERKMAKKFSFDPFSALFRRHLLAAVAVAAQLIE